MQPARRFWTGTPHDVQPQAFRTLSSAPAPARARRISLRCGSSAYWPPGARPDEILATTFTRKAAGEILDRVLFWLAKAAADDGERAKLADDIGDQSAHAQNNAANCSVARSAGCMRCASARSTAISCKSRPASGTSWACRRAGRSATSWPTGSSATRRSSCSCRAGRLADLMTLVHSLTKGAASRSVARLVRDTVTRPVRDVSRNVARSLAADRRLQGTRRRRAGRGAGGDRRVRASGGKLCKTAATKMWKGARPATGKGLIENGLCRQGLERRKRFQ